MRTDRIRRRRWFQFSLRSLLLLTTASAVACAWWLRPVPREIPLPDGVLIRLEQVRSSADDSDSPTYVQWELRTTEGQRIARGVERDEILHGRLFLYHADGRPAIEGVLRSEGTGRHLAVVVAGRQAAVRMEVRTGGGNFRARQHVARLVA
jgi:hypothetical protein